MLLTEEETEYSVVAVKYVFDAAVALQFTCSNTVAEQILENVTVAVDLADAVRMTLTLALTTYTRRKPVTSDNFSPPYTAQLPSDGMGDGNRGGFTLFRASCERAVCPMALSCFAITSPGSRQASYAGCLTSRLLGAN